MKPDLTDRDWQKIDDKGCDAEEMIIEQFCTQLNLPSKDWCDEAIHWQSPADTAGEIAAEFDDKAYDALHDMWKNKFSKDAVRRHQYGGDHWNQMLCYAVNRVFRKLAHDHPESVKNKVISYKGYKEEIDAATVLCLVNKTHIGRIWFSCG